MRAWNKACRSTNHRRPIRDRQNYGMLTRAALQQHRGLSAKRGLKLGMSLVWCTSDAPITGVPPNTSRPRWLKAMPVHTGGKTLETRRNAMIDFGVSWHLNTSRRRW
jgi:hypothetical protein